MPKTTQFKGDSFVVDITPPDRNGRPSGVFVYRRKQRRSRGKVAVERKPLYIDYLPESPTARNVSVLAKKIGKAMLKVSTQLRRVQRGGN